MIQVMEDESIKAARKSWDNWIYRIHGDFLTWKTLAILLLVLLIVVIFFAGYYFIQPKFIPYVVYVKENGNVEFKGRIETDSIDATNAIIRHYLIRFISDISKVSTDPVAHKNRLIDAYYLVTENGSYFLTEYIKESGILEIANDMNVHVDVRFMGFYELAESTWKVEWQEIIRESGVHVGVRERVGTFVYERSSAESEIDAEKNPVGIYFSSFDIRENRRFMENDEQNVE